MEVGRLRKGEWLVAAASVALLGVMFLAWFGEESPAGGTVRSSAWQAFTVWDVVLAVFAAMGLSLVALVATRRAPAGPVAAGVLTAGVGIVLTPALLLRLLFPPGPNDLVALSSGAWLGLLCTVAIAAGAWLAMGDERTDAVEPPSIPAQPTPPAHAPAGSVVAEGRVPSADDDRD